VRYYEHKKIKKIISLDIEISINPPKKKKYKNNNIGFAKVIKHYQSTMQN